MNMDDNAKDKLSPLRHIDLSSEDKTDILEHLRREMSSTPKRRQRRKRDMRALPSVAAAVAAVALVAGGVDYGVHSGHLLTVPTQKVTTAASTGNSAVSPQITSANSNASHWQEIGKQYSVEGTIVSASKSSFVLNVRKDLQGANTAVDTGSYPFKSGSHVTIRISTPFASDHVHLNAGTEVVVTASQYVSGSDQNAFWGTTASGFYYMKSNGNFYNLNGNKLSLFNQQPSTVSSNHVVGHRYSSVSAAAADVTQVEQNAGLISGGQPVSLGLGIQGKFNGGAGQYAYQWTEGNWTLVTEGSGNSSAGQRVAQSVVSYLHSHLLPAPNNKGVIIITQSSANSAWVTKVAWQEGDHVYQLQHSGNPTDTLSTLTTTNSASSSNPAKVEITATPSTVSVGQSVTIQIHLLTANGGNASNARFTLNIPGNLNYATEYTDANGAFTTSTKWNKPGTYTISAGDGKVGWQELVIVK